MKYESELIKEIVDLKGHHTSLIHDDAECIEMWIDEVKGAYPKLNDYQSEWLNYIVENPIGEFPYVNLTDVTAATVDNVVPYAYKTAILKGSTKYRDIDTGEFLETFEEGRNLELVSVKMPVLTTIGKNLFNSDNRVIEPSNTYGYIDFTDYDGTITYSISDKDTSINLNGIYFGVTYQGRDFNGTNPNNGGWLFANGEFEMSSVTTSKSKYFSFFPNNQKTLDKIMSRYNIQVEIGSTATPYEPYKSNILTVKEEVTLRGVGDVKDELNLLTGELTQRIGEVVLDGSEGWYMEKTTGSYYTSLNDLGIKLNLNANNVLCDRFKYRTEEEQSTIGCCALGGGTGSKNGNLLINYDELTGGVENFKNYLKQNPLTIQVQTDESIKTVDLSVHNQDDKVLVRIKPIEGTMSISTSSDTVIPTFSGEIPVEAIAQNLASFIEE